MLKLMWRDGHAEWVPVTEQEDAERVEFLKAIDAIPAIPEAEKVLDYFPGGNLDSYGKRTMYQVEKFYADFYAEHDAQKEKRRKDRAGKEYRHRKPENRHAHGERYSMSFGKHECGNDHVRNLHREIGLRKDYDDEKWWAEYDAEIAEYERKRKAEDLKAHIEHMNNLWRWLEWA